MTSGAVFVDATGRRARLVAVACWTLACLFGSYVLLVAVALVIPPGTLSFTVPGLGPVLPKTEPPQLSTGNGHRGVPVSVLAKLPTHAPKAQSPGHATPRRTTSSPSPTGIVPGTVPATAPSPTPTGRTPGKPSTHPTPNPKASKTHP